MLKIGLDAHHIGNNKTGAEVYLIELIKNLSLIDSVNQYHIFISKHGIDFANNFNKNNFSFHQISVNNLFLQRLIILPIKAKMLELDLLHVHRVTPLISSAKLVVTIHDLAHEIYPDNFSKKEAMAMRFLVPKAARKASKIITDSDSSKEDLVNCYNINSEKIEVTPLGINREIFNPIKNQEQMVNILTKYNIAKPYLFYIGSIEPRKNLEVIIKAMAVLKANNQLKYSFIIAGRPRPGKEGYKDSLIRLINKFGLNGKIVFIGQIASSDLPFLYNAASIFVFPSFFEGFGFPPLEAMACGIPTIVANASSLASVVGDAAIKIDASDIDKWGKTINKLMTNDKLCEELSAKGINQASKFSWVKLAKQTLDVYKEIMGEI